MKTNFDEYAEERHQKLLTGMMPAQRYVEKPMMMSMMPDLKGKRVLMLGCGTGEESEILRNFGAEPKDLVGIDTSEKSIEIAKETYPDIEFMIADMRNIPFEDNSFDFIYSSLAVHYSPNIEDVYKEVYRLLKSGGEFLFSVGHPIRWASETKEIDGKVYRLTGCAIDDSENEIIGHYNTYQEYTHTRFAWGMNETLIFHVGSPSFHFKLLRKTNFEVLDFTESQAVEEAKEVDMNYYIKNSEMPQFMAFLAKKQ